MLTKAWTRSWKRIQKSIQNDRQGAPQWWIERDAHQSVDKILKLMNNDDNSNNNNNNNNNTNKNSRHLRTVGDTIFENAPTDN